MEPERQQQLKQPLLQGEDPDEAIIRQRNEEMKRLVDDLGDLRDVAKEISIMIGDQGQDIKQIDTNVSSTNEHVNRAVGETEKASKYQAAARKKIAIIVVVCVLILGLVVTLIVLGALGKI
jgi:t-SNARE complex subunit (syntaxin)